MRQVAGLLKSILALVLFIGMAISSAMIDDSLSVFVKMWGSAGVALVYFSGMALLFNPRGRYFGFAVLAYFALFLWWLLRLNASVTSLHWRVDHPGTMKLLDALRQPLIGLVPLALGKKPPPP